MVPFVGLNYLSLDDEAGLSQRKAGGTAVNRMRVLVTVRAFTLRLPEDLYLEVADRAIAAGRTQNAECIELLRIGLGRKMDVRKALQDLMDREFSESDITVFSGRPVCEPTDSS